MCSNCPGSALARGPQNCGQQEITGVKGEVKCKSPGPASALSRWEYPHCFLAVYFLLRSHLPLVPTGSKRLGREPLRVCVRGAC